MFPTNPELILAMHNARRRELIAQADAERLAAAARLAEPQTAAATRPLSTAAHLVGALIGSRTGRRRHRHASTYGLPAQRRPEQARQASARPPDQPVVAEESATTGHADVTGDAPDFATRGQ